MPAVLLPGMALCLALALLGGCATAPSGPAPAAVSTAPPAAGLQYTIQVGAFRDQENALRLAEKLRRSGIADAFSYVEGGYHKVRFGNFPTHAEARSVAKRLRKRGIISSWFVVRPESYAARRFAPDGLRRSIVATASEFIGVPYRWGGTSRKTGFDCSGLSMVVYRLNGIDLPRTSRRQFTAGRPVPKERLLPGDLVFFSTDGSGRVNHVGIYAGNGVFIHAPRAGKKITKARLGSGYFRRHFVGARRFL